MKLRQTRQIPCNRRALLVASWLLMAPEAVTASDIFADPVVKQNMMQGLFKVNGKNVFKAVESRFRDQILTYETEKFKINEEFSFFCALPETDLDVKNFPILLDKNKNIYFYATGLTDINKKCIINILPATKNTKIFINLYLIILINSNQIITSDTYFFNKLMILNQKFLNNHVVKEPSYCNIRMYNLQRYSYGIRDKIYQDPYHKDYFLLLTEREFVIYFITVNKYIYSKISFNLNKSLKLENLRTDLYLNEGYDNTGFSPKYILDRVDSMYKQNLGGSIESYYAIFPYITYNNCDLFYVDKNVYNNPLEYEAYGWDFGNLIGYMDYGFIKTSYNQLRNRHDATLIEIRKNAIANIDVGTLTIINNYLNYSYKYQNIEWHKCINPIISWAHDWPFADCRNDYYTLIK